MKKKPEITNIIKGAVARAGYSMRSLCNETGLSYSTVAHNRLNDPGGWTFREFGAITRLVHFNNEEMTQIFEAMKGNLRR